MLDEGHQQMATSPVDANPGDVVDMPHGSAAPVLLAAALSLVFTALVIGRFGVAGVCGVLCLLVLVGWHWHEPREEVA